MTGPECRQSKKGFIVKMIGTVWWVFPCYFGRWIFILVQAGRAIRGKDMKGRKMRAQEAERGAQEDT